MNKTHIDFRRVCILISIILLASFADFAVYAAESTPTAADITKTQTQNSAIYFTQDDFANAFSSETSGLKAIKVVTLPDSGFLTLKGSAVTEGSEIPFEEFSEIMYTPKPDSVYETNFMYQARNEELYSSSAIIKIIITDASAGPLRSENSSISTKKNTPVSSTMIGYCEAEATQKPDFIIVDVPTKGKVDVSDVNTGTFTYTPFTDQLGDDYFTFRLVLSPYESEISTVSITIDDTPDVTLFQYADLQTHWAAYSAAMLVERNITIGEKIGNKYYYRPDKQLTRGDFVLLLSAAIGIDSMPEYSGTQRFADEDSMPSYMIEPAYRALEAGIISGIYDNGRIYFGSNNSLTRIEALVMVNNAINPDVESATELDYSDLKSIPAWAIQAVKNMEGYGLIKGYDDNTLRPHSLIIKSQGGEIIYQLVKYLDAYPQTRAKLTGGFVAEAHPISYNVQKGYVSSVVR